MLLFFLSILKENWKKKQVRIKSFCLYSFLLFFDEPKFQLFTHHHRKHLILKRAIHLPIFRFSIKRSLSSPFWTLLWQSIRNLVHYHLFSRRYDWFSWKFEIENSTINFSNHFFLPSLYISLSLSIVDSLSHFPFTEKILNDSFQ